MSQQNLTNINIGYRDVPGIRGFWHSDQIGQESAKKEMVNMVRMPTSGDEDLAVYGKDDYGITFSHDKSNL